MRWVVSSCSWLSGIAFGASVALCASNAFAQAAPAAAPAPAAEPPIIRPYVVLKPSFIFATAALESFGQPNASAPTAAGNQALAAPGLEDEPFTTFQAAQSRLGFWFDEKGPVRAHFEFDFIDFAKSSPTTQALVRLRIAAVEWKLSDSLLLAAGQDWDLYGPINPHSYNIVSVAYQAGNTAFMRHQMKLIHTSESMEVGVALGMAGINPGARLAVPEFNQMPSLAARAALLFGAAGRVGISALASRWRFAPGADTERYAFAGAAGIYGDVTPAAGLNIRFEAYGGRNLNNTGALSLGTGNNTNDLDEAGGVASFKYSLTDAHALQGLVGMAQVLNDEDVAPAYTYGTVAEGMTPAAGSATIAGTGPGMAWNRTARLGYEYRYSKSTAFVLEGFMFQSKHVLDPVDADRFDDERTALGAELGLFFTL